MSKHTLIVAFPTLQGLQNVHRIRNFAEVMYRLYMHNQRGIVEDMDAITDEFRIFIPKARFLGQVLKTLNDELKKHHLFEDAIVSKREGIHKSSKK